MRRQQYIPGHESTMTSQAEYDYIVVGGGTAGCVVAARLSEQRAVRVLLLEAGSEDRSFWIHVPLGFPKLYGHPTLNWRFETAQEPQLDGRTLYQPRGKVLGGSSSINAMLYVRGNPSDYDGWERAGCSGWGWEDVRRYFDRAENGIDGEIGDHQPTGPLDRSSYPGANLLADRFVAAGEQFGFRRERVLIDSDEEAVGFYTTTASGGRRRSTAQAYLSKARVRSNLRVITHAHVSRLLIENGCVKGVEFRHGGEITTVRAAREVVLSAGVFGNPQILHLSGIGPAEVLKELGVEVKHASPEVGMNLQDHFFVQAMYRCTKAITVNELANSRVRQLRAGIQYVLFRSGILAHNGVFAGAFARSDPRLAAPDVQITMTSWSIAERTRDGMRPHPFPGFSLGAIHLNPEARGSVITAQQAPLAHPIIRFNFLAADADISASIAGLKIARRLAKYPALASLVREELLPGIRATSDHDLEAFIRSHGGSNHHPVGTCRMGGDERSVVDPQLRVRGIGGLRIADGSVIPRIPRGNPLAATVMIAEKSAHMIRTAAQ